MSHRILLAAGASLAALTLSAPALAETEAEAPDYPQMTFGDWGFDPASLDREIDPGDDFNAYVNGKWAREAELPADRPFWMVSSTLQERANEDIEAIIEEMATADPLPGTSERRILDLYNAYLDRDAINEAGLTPAYPYLTKIFAAEDLTELVTLFPQAGYPAMISASVGIDSKNPDKHKVSFGFSGMGMTDRDQYLVDSERNFEIRAAYMELLEFMLGKAGYEDPASAARAVYAFERKVAELEWDTQYFRNPDLTYNSISQAELLALAPEFPMAELLAGYRFDQADRYLVAQLPPSEEDIAAAELTEEDLAQIGGGLPAMLDLMLETPLETIKAYMAVRFLSSNAGVLPSDIDEANFAFYGTMITGSQEQRPRDKRALAVVQSYLGEELGAIYVERHFPAEAKVKMDQLVENLRATMREKLVQNDWMTPQTTEQALTKLELMTPMIGYPEKFETYEGLEMKADDPLGNRMRRIAWGVEDNLSDLGQPVDRKEWYMTPQTVNAYFGFLANQIVFPAAFLQPPFFDPNGDTAVNYGAIGSVIGHEIGHGYDDQGSRYDEIGRLRDWWQESDREAFEAKADKMATFIEAYCPLDEGKLCLTGRQSMGEVLGDLIGLNMAYQAYRRSLNGEEPPIIDGLTGDQRFFLGFAQNWRSKFRPEFLRYMLGSASHPPNEFRLNNTVRHMDAWYEAFNVTPDDELYLPPEERIKIW